MPSSVFPTGDVIRRLILRLKMRHLQLIVQVHRVGSLTRVAELMATSQPAVTNTLSELEALFGTPLFVRTARGMRPTEVGNIVTARAQAMLQDLGQLVQDMEASHAGMAARLHVGVTPFVSGRLIADAVLAVQSEPQRLAVRIHDGTTDHLLRALREHELDVVIARASPRLDLQGLHFEPLYQQQARLVSNRQLAAQLGRVPLSWERLAELDWVLGEPNTALREQVAALFIQAGITPPVPITEGYSAKLIGEIIASSDRAVSLLPADIANELVHIAGIAIVPYTIAWSLPPIAAIVRSDAATGDARQRFVDAIRQASLPMRKPPNAGRQTDFG
ncbi:LysR substrate-binding domain-containing protein [Bordetella sp. 02P26C-1]|uniref:LysR substrate-binding domain-containing protein n=1 Tax=Bordetella sp. 02P26C-1 TaxID=2683195 RepID=UPI001353985A|nr:LysR substrate-binding domain-containing protein [Bordetella sp. 02P26C-1]MVW78898.1 LysR family transcriptional regulator [Bordetella sp. 02P26C-1]